MNFETFSCPYCNEELSIPVDVTAGRKQRFVYDCEICCSPIVCLVETDGARVLQFIAEKEE